jgi:DNA mismatch endonuclease (patch repair protein)
MDVFDKSKRSWIMSHVKGKDTKPEILVRSIVHKHGFRFRLHKSDLPGNPDIALVKYRKVIFVHGCFWHGHKRCSRARRPLSNISFWREKLGKNMERDRKNIQALKDDSWSVLVIWECETKKIDKLTDKILSFLTITKG